MASPHISDSRRAASAPRPYRRSSFNGAKQLAAAGATTRRTLVVVGVLVVALVAVLGVIAFHLAGSGK